MLGLQIANLVVSSLVLAALTAAGVRVAVLSARAKERRQRRPIDTAALGKVAAALITAASTNKPTTPRRRGATVTDLKKDA